jgi:hypothetical protein
MVRHRVLTGCAAGASGQADFPFERPDRPEGGFDAHSGFDDVDHLGGFDGDAGCGPDL